jgi:ribosome-associated translation inhibitor RaiA
VGAGRNVERKKALAGIKVIDMLAPLERGSKAGMLSALLSDYRVFAVIGCHLSILSQSQEENTMQIQINTDHNIENHEALAAQVSSVVESALSRISDHITRVEVHLSDESSHKSSQNDKRCMMEARLERHQPIAVTHHAATLNQAVEGAADKLARLIENTLERRHEQQSHRTDPQPPEPTDN